MGKNALKKLIMHKKPYSLTGASGKVCVIKRVEAWDRYKDLLHERPHHGFTELHQFDTFYNALNPADQDSLNSAAGGNLLERRTEDVLTIIENKSKVHNSQNKLIVSQVKSSDANSSSSSEIAKLTHAVNQQTSAVTTAMTAILKKFQANPSPASVKAVEEILVTCGGARPYYQCLTADGNTFSEFWDNIQVYVSAAVVNYNQGNSSYRPPDKMLKAFLSNKEKLLELKNTPLNENCLTVILKKLPEKLGDPGKFLILCGFIELKCKALANLGARINLMPLSVWKNLDVFVSVGKFTFPADFVIVDYESDPRVPLILGRPFLQTARALIGVHGEEMILYNGDERLTLNMRHETSSYSNQTQKESINMINIYNDSYEDYLEDLFAINHLSGNPTFSSHTDLTSPEVKYDIFDPEGDIVLIEKLLNFDSTKDLPPPYNINPLSGSTTSSSFSSNQLLEEFVDELALITFPLGNDDLPFDIKSDLREIEYFLNHDPTKEIDSILEDSLDESNLANTNDNLFDTIPDMFIVEHALDYLSLPLYDEYDDDLFEIESDNGDAYNDPFNFKGEKIKESKLLIDELDLPRSSDFLPSLEYDSFLFKDFSEVDALPSTNNEDKVFNPGILIQENLSEIIVQTTLEKNVKKIAISHASLILEDFDPPLYELPFHKEVPCSETLLSFSSKNKEKVFKTEILISKGVHTSLLLEICHRFPKAFKVTKIVESPMEIFPCSFEEYIGKDYAQNVKNQSKTRQYRTQDWKSAAKAGSTSIFLNNRPMSLKSQKKERSWSILANYQKLNQKNKHAQLEDSNELFQTLLKDLQIVKKELIECNRPDFFDDNEDHSLIREECCIEVCKEQKQNMENTILEMVKIYLQKELLCMHDNIDDLIESALNSKLLLINSQCLDKEQEVKNVVEQPTECRNRIEKSLQNFRVIHKSSISLNNTSKFSLVHAVAPILSTKEPEYSPSMGYENPNTTPETESDEIIKSGVEELVPILSENEVTSEDKRECDVPVCENSPIFDDHYEIFSDSNNDDDISSDDDDFEDIEYVEASLPNLEIVSVEEEYVVYHEVEENVVHQEEEEFDLEDIQDVVLREKLLGINCLIANIKSLNDNPTSDRVLNSSVSLPIFEESNNSLSDNFSPEFETFCDHTEETRSGSTTTHAHKSLPEYDSFCFEIEPDQERLINIVKNDISDDSLNDPLLEEADLFLASDNSIPSDTEFDFEPDSGEEISVVMNDNNELKCLDPKDEINVFTNDENDDYSSFMFVIYSKVFFFSTLH
nr:hypothetical protein [Tanacetum cinerariifolium]